MSVIQGAENTLEAYDMSKRRAVKSCCRNEYNFNRFANYRARK